MAELQKQLINARKEVEESKKEIARQRKIITDQANELSSLLSAPRKSKTPFVPIKLYSGGLPPYDKKQQKNLWMKKILK